MDQGGESGDDSEMEDSFSRSLCKKRLGLLLVSLAMTDFLIFMSLSVLAPFYPKEAESRKLSNTMSSLVFGVFSLVQFVVSPIFGKIALYTGVEFLFLVGLFVGGVSTIVFGLMEYVEDSFMFMSLSIIIRIFIALGCSASNTASLIIIARSWPSLLTTLVGILETSSALGYMVGPALGGALYSLGGFILPFIVLGSLLVIAIPISWLLLGKREKCEIVVENNNYGLMRSCCNFNFIAVSIAIVCCSLIWAFIDPILERRLNSLFSLSPTIVGLVFLLTSAAYALTAPFLGYVVDRRESLKIPFLFSGFLICAISFLLLAPSKWLGLENYNELWLCLLSLILLGIGSSLTIVPTFVLLLQSMTSHKGEMPKHSYVAGIWSCEFALGEFLGPVIAGSLVDRIGFSDCLNYIAIIPISMFILWIFMYFKMGRNSPLKTEVRVSTSEETLQSEGADETSSLLNEKSVHRTQIYT
ncbi:DgyrCDS3908 [Dimorphilus gyrociliatus]|uniref:DgyrCDS3908 n=1 Tax=Dimorphilus gyrociliatus TaxID=2664684 RepID=A0A7I8VF22_9ANNE|nr:DgyrCDS3908 [Dimorphilus gyrociliatus]